MKIDDRRAAVACALGGALLALLPHLGELTTVGTAQYLASGDDVLYLAIAKRALAPGWGLSDAFSSPDGSLPALYSWLTFVPLAKAWGALGLPLTLLPLAWRLIGGALLGFSLFAIFRRVLGPLERATAWALGCALVCLFDPGFIHGRPVVDGLLLLSRLASGTPSGDTSGAYNQYRVVTPILNLPFLILLAAWILPGRSHGWKRTAAAGALLAACVYLYFFFWTGAALALGFLAAWHGLLAWNRPTRGARHYHFARARFSLAVLAIGLALGALQIFWNAHLFSDPAFREPLDRMSRGLAIPLGDPGRHQYLWNTWVWLKLAIGACGILVMKMRRLTPLWALTLAGYWLRNSAIVTGLEFENYHWALVSNPFGEIMILAVGAVALERRRAWRGVARPLWMLPAGLAALALAWIPNEASLSRESREARRLIGELSPMASPLAALPPGCVLAGPSEVNVAYLYSSCSGQLYQYDHTSQSSLIPDHEVHERHALNSWLQGMDAAEYGAIAATTFNTVALPRENWSPAAVRAKRLEVFSRLEHDPEYVKELISRFRPSALVLHEQRGAPRRGGPWVLAAAAGHWNLWVPGPPGS